jgi:type IV fimbrial biogenesis protein FimT
MAPQSVPRASRGFTLIELIVVVVIIAVVSAIALPGFQELIRSNRLTTETNALLGSLSLARTEAIRGNHSPVGNRDVVLCPSADGATCGNDWTAGWIVARRVDDTVDTVIRHIQPAVGMSVASAQDEIVFDNRGRRLVGPNTLTVRPLECPAGQPYVRTLTLNASGQVRVTPGPCP